MLIMNSKIIDEHGRLAVRKVCRHGSITYPLGPAPEASSEPRESAAEDEGASGVASMARRLLRAVRGLLIHSDNETHYQDQR
jgi:hypothetical protein